MNGRIRFIRTLFRENYQPDREISVDESLVLYKGRLRFKQYIKSKCARFGVKVFSLCSSDWYMYNFEVYSGQGDQTFPAPVGGVDGIDLSNSERIVTHLMKDLLDRGYSMYTDNWYTSVRLAQYLLTRHTMLTRTIRVNRGLQALVQQQCLTKGQSFFARKDALLALKYQNKREVHLLSTEHTAGFNEQTRYQPGGGRGVLMQPRIIKEYSKYMQGVDRTDQLMHSYDCTRKSYSWFEKLGIHFFQRSLLNAHYIFQQSTDSNMTFLTFLQSAVNYLALGLTDCVQEINANPLDRSAAGLPRRHAAARRGGSAGGRPAAPVHAAELIPATATRARPQRRCINCTSHGIRKDSRYICPACPDKPALCLGCFQLYNHY